ncbi:ISAs1 family transposase [Streptomyces synnematoformans]|uniref:Transposase IS4-like domain-containing protein n=1 Tax=Streptomyces synnematoformans TaxID=415721 RepID=A0ABN2Y962_9ACTN
MIAVDGKTLRGSRTHNRPATALIAAMTHDGDVLAQTQIHGRSNEIPAFAPLLEGIDLEGSVITADALHAEHDHASYLHERGAHYPAVVKRNHPTLHERTCRLTWRDIRLDHFDRNPGPPPRRDSQLEDSRVRAPGLPTRPPGPSSRPLEAGPGLRQTDDRADLPGHQPAARHNHRHGTRHMDPRPPEARKPAPPCPGPHLPRGRVEDPYPPPAPRIMDGLRNLAIGVHR